MMGTLPFSVRGELVSDGAVVGSAPVVPATPPVLLTTASAHPAHLVVRSVGPEERPVGHLVEVGEGVERVHHLAACARA